LNQLNAKESEGEVLCLIAEVQSFVEPLLATNELRVQGEKAAMSVGDVHTACFCRLQYCSAMLWAGQDLSTVKEEVSKAYTFMEQQEHWASLALLSVIIRTLNILIGNENETRSLNVPTETADDDSNAGQTTNL
jgi:hypothetical protein